MTGKYSKKKLPMWQETYIERLNLEYIKILQEHSNPSEKFWALEKRIQKDKRCLGVIVEMKRQNMIHILMSLLNDEVITHDDLDEFSSEIREAVKFFLGR